MKRNSSAMRRAVVGLTVALIGLGLPLAAVADQTNNPPAEAPARPGQTERLPYTVEYVVGMQQQGVDEEAILNFIRATAVPYSFTAEQILDMHRLGLPNAVISALIQRGAQLEKEHQVPPPVVLVDPATDYPYYAYDYPSDDYFYDYVYPYYFDGAWVFGGGWWWGHGDHHHGGHHGGGGHGGFGGGFGGGHGGGGGGGHR
jgi:uncharacterized membrane protein YgcG